MSDEDRSGYYLWFDTEFTSLELDDAELLQVALVVTDRQLKRVAPPDQDVRLFLQPPPGTVFSPWVEENLGELLTLCRSDKAVTVEEVDRRLAEHVTDLLGPMPVAENLRPVLAGNSVHGDWYLARKYLPAFSACLHYRHLDVSSLKVEWLGWYRGEPFDKTDANLLRQHFPQAGAALDGQPHDAYYDVLASIAELGFYRKNLSRSE